MQAAVESRKEETLEQTMMINTRDLKKKKKKVGDYNEEAAFRPSSGFY